MKTFRKITIFILSILLIPAFALPVLADDIDTLPEEITDMLGGEDIDDYEYWLKEGITSEGEDSSSRTLPSWYPEDVNSFRDFHNENAPRIVDNADLFTDSEEQYLSGMIRASITATKADLVIYTDTTNYGLGNQLCAADFYQFNGYGLGDDYNGSVLFINMDPMDREYYTAVRGESRKYITEDTINKLHDRAYDDMKDGDYAAAMEKYIDGITGLFTTGKVPESPGAFMGRLVTCIIIGLIVGLIVMGVLTSQMKKVKIATKAREYLVRDSVNMRAAYDYFLYATVTRTKIDKGGKGGSSFSGGFSSSGGGSFSGGGRRF